MSAASVSDPKRATEAAAYFGDLQTRICRAFEVFEDDAEFTTRPWSRPAGHRLQGGGTMRQMRGSVFEKVGVNVSHVWGALAPQFKDQIPGAQESKGRFEACGISLVAHMFNPYVPAVHMNLRYLSTSRAWFGGGSDLTPTFPDAVDTAAFHAALKGACDSYRADAYREFKEACDKYFFIPHRQEARGVGGIFFDQLASGDAAADFVFVRAVGEAFLSVYPQIVARGKDSAFDDAARDQLLLKRGRYVEFNLVYDRGTQFGFGTDADPEAYLMSLPPLVRW
jgi:coproporphyrinogen III oxidase